MILAALLAVPMLTDPLAPPRDVVAVGTSAPEIDGKAFLNSLGAQPSLANLRGQAVLIEFWFTT